MHEHVERLEQAVMVEIQDSIDAILSQAEKASELIAEMRLTIGAGEASDGASSSDDSSSTSDEDSDET